MLVACVGLYGERVEQAEECIEKLMPLVDRYVVIIDETVSHDQIQLLKELGCEVYLYPWEDSMVKMRNQYLNKVQTGDWVIVHDPDECFNDTFCRDIKSLCKNAEEDDVVLLLVNSRDITIGVDGEGPETTSDHFKNLIFQKREGARYEGVGEHKHVHETLIFSSPPKVVQLSKDQYWYVHIKFWHEVWERAARNVFMAGGGNNVGETNIAWLPLLECFKHLGIMNWPAAREYLRKGDISLGLKEWLWLNRYEGFDYHHEMMEMGRWYFEYLHPDEKQFADGRIWEPVHDLAPGSAPEVMRYVEETYQKILGRHAEVKGKTSYTEAILGGTMLREDLPTILKQSPEYKELSGKTVEQVKIHVPVQAQIALSEDLFLDAMRRSRTYWEQIKPVIDVGKHIQNGLSEEDWKEFLKYFYKEKPQLPELLDSLILYLMGDKT